MAYVYEMLNENGARINDTLKEVLNAQLRRN